MKTKKKVKTKLVPMKAVKCPICEGGGRVYSESIKAKIKCKGCDSKGWVEVHMSEPVPAPRTQTITGEPYKTGLAGDWTYKPSDNVYFGQSGGRLKAVDKLTHT